MTSYEFTVLHTELCIIRNVILSSEANKLGLIDKNEYRRYIARLMDVAHELPQKEQKGD